MQLPHLLKLSSTLASILLCAGWFTAARASTELLVSVPDQRLVVLKNNLQVDSFRVSTSKFGLGDRPRSYGTPLGKLAVAKKVGAGAPLGTVFKGQRRTGEILRPNARGRDPIVTRILALRGCESKNANALRRGIYIHGTPQERQIGRPASYGCIRMRSRDVARLFDVVGVGTPVRIENKSVASALRLVASR